MTALILLCLSFTALNTFAADTQFENSISAFPDSYKESLRKLHEKYPSWTFTPLFTNLDWYDAVDGEYVDDNSLVSNHSAYTDIFKSREADDFNYSTGSFIEKDAGFVKANKLAISYYMDPRNFLNEQGIFQFENLAFDEVFGIDAIEIVLKGTFMSNKKISYLNSKGVTVNTDETYAQVLYQAGKQYNINPCFLAAKILSEVGKNGSGSVSGKYVNPKTGLCLYPGIYNFYNIGATDTLASSSTTPIEKGLSYAKNGTTYQRPWDTPKKAIFGGAEFNAEKYIAKGQHTSYLQRFNVNPDSAYETYTHQYMTALTGAAHPAYSNYQSCLSGNMLDFPFNFIIPVYNNMSGSKNSVGAVRAADSYNQTGTLSTAYSTYNVRKGPSTNYDLFPFTLSSGTAVKVTDTVFTDSTYYDNIMKYPYWKKISFTNNSVSYTGYVYSNFVSLSTYTVVQTGLYTPVEFTANSSLSLNYISSDPSIAKVINDRTIQFLKPGIVEITAYDSIGNYQVIRYRVYDNINSFRVNNVNVSEDENGTLNITFDPNSYYNYYEVFVTNTSNKVLKGKTVAESSASFENIPADQNVRVYVRGLRTSGNNRVYSSFAQPATFVMKLVAPTGVKAVQSGYHSVKLSWNPVAGAAGYEISAFDSGSGLYVPLGYAGASETSYLDKSQNLLTGATYRIRAYRMSGSSKVFSDYSSAVVFKACEISVARVASLKQTAADEKGYTLSWSAVSDVDSYWIYRYDVKTKKYVKIASTSKNLLRITDQPSASTARYSVRAVVTLFGKNYYSPYSPTFDACSAPAKTTKIVQSDTTVSSYTLKWSAVRNATGYLLYRYDTKKGGYTKIANTKNTYYKLSSLRAGQAVKYCVKAYVQTKNGVIYGKYVEYTALTCPPQVSGIKQKNATPTSYTLYWNRIGNVNVYKVYKYDKAKKKYIAIANTANNYLNISGKKPGESDRYRIVAYTRTASGYVRSAVSATFEAAASPTAVTGFKASSQTTSSYKLSWNKASGNTGYVIFRRSAGGAYKTLKIVSGNSYTVKGLKSRSTSTYIVRAYKKTASATVYGPCSPVLNAKTK